MHAFVDIDANMMSNSHFYHARLVYFSPWLMIQEDLLGTAQSEACTGAELGIRTARTLGVLGTLF